MLDIENTLLEIAPDAPCGENLEYDPEFGELERTVRTAPENQLVEADREAEEPDWPAAEKLALALLKRTKDLRIAAILTQALVRTRGWAGFHEGLALMRGLLERYWDSLHPQLDAEDDNDPTLRINTLVSLCDPALILEPLRQSPLVRSRLLGSFSLRDLLIANKELQPSASDTAELPEPAAIEAAFKEVALEDLQATADAIRLSNQDLAAIEALLLERVGTSQAPNLGKLSDLIKTASKMLGKHLAERLGVPDGNLEQLQNAPETSEDTAVPTAAQPGASTLGAINSRADVVRAIDLVCDYYQRQEPSSPIPLLLMRAKRLVAKDFMEILQDLAPDGLSQAEKIRGTTSESDE